MQGVWHRTSIIQIFSLITLRGLVVIGFSLARLTGTAIENTATERARAELTDVIRNRRPFWLDLPPTALRTVHAAPDAVAGWQARGITARTTQRDPPCSGAARPATISRKVLLPQPDGPTRQAKQPEGTAIECGRGKRMRNALNLER